MRILPVLILLFYYIFYFLEKSATPETNGVVMSPASTDRETGNLSFNASLK